LTVVPKWLQSESGWTDWECSRRLNSFRPLPHLIVKGIFSLRTEN